jgi:hypothetical protein
VESSCERGNEHSCSIKCWESTEWLHNLWPLEWYSAPQSQLVSLPWLTSLFSDFPPLRPGFEPGSGHVGFVVDKSALWQVIS